MGKRELYHPAAAWAAGSRDVSTAESGVTPLRVYAAGEPLTAALEAGAPPPVLELPPPAVEAAPPARGLMPKIKSWTVRT